MTRRGASSWAIHGAVLVGVASLIAIIASCGVEVDLSNKTCPCPTGLVCDPSTNRCVSTLPAATGPAIGDGGSSEPPPPACTDATCPCEKNEDCRDPSRRYCGPSKTCVECLATPDTCTAGGYCNEKNQCIVGCKTASDCPDGKCQLTTHRCVECTANTECGVGKVCSPSGKCATACVVSGSSCGGGYTCCGGFCVSLDDDVLNCGACGTACSTTNGTPSCAAKKCSWECAAGFAHCASPSENGGCETEVRSVDNCGACGVTCTAAKIVFADGIACGGTSCTYASCKQGHFDADKNPSNGCEKTCGGGNEQCCPKPQQPCNNGDNCKGNGKCQP